jgi:hypothetical protein
MNVEPIISLAVLLIAGCAIAPPTIQQQQPISADLSRYRNVQVLVEAPDDVRKESGYESTSSELLRQFIGSVKSAGRYAFVGSEPPADPALEARLKITEFVYVSGATRVMTGVLSGRSTLAVTMTLRDKQSAAVLGEVSARHTSDLFQGVFSASSADQITAIAKELASKLQ